MSRHVLVTGAAGFIGYHFARRLLAGGDAVVGFDNLNDYYDPALKEARLAELAPDRRFRFVRGDLADQAAVDALFTGRPFDAVVHLAAQAGVRYSITHPRSYAQSNLAGFLNVLEACRHAKTPHLVFASSSSVYGANGKQPFSERDGVDHPVSLYAASKKANELMAHTYAALYGLPVTGLRFFTVYGPWGRPDMSPFQFVGKILSGQPIQVFNHGHHRRDFTYVDDIVEGLYRITALPPKGAADWDAQHPDPATSTAPYAIYNLGNGSPVDLLEYIRTIEAAVGKPAIMEMLPQQPGDVAETYADTSRLRAATGYAPSTPLKLGIERFVAWYRGYYKV